MKKINMFIKKHFVSILIIFIILQPIIDVMTSIMIKMNFSITIGILSKLLFLLYLLYGYLFVFKNISKKIIIYLISIFIYLLFYYLFNDFYSLKETIKILFFPICLILIYKIFKEGKYNLEDNLLVKISLLYSLFIIVPFILNIGFDSYEVAKKGSLGLYNSANEISAILSIIFPILFYNLYNKFNILSIIILLVSSLIIGTKTPILSFIICIIFYTIKYIIDNKKSKKYNKIIFLSIILLIFIFLSILLIPNTYFYKNLVIHYKFLKLNKLTDLFNLKTLDHFLLGSRLKFAIKLSKFYFKSNIFNKIFGIGYLKVAKLSEMDLIDIYFRNGIFMLLIIAIPIIKIIKDNKLMNNKYLLSIIISFIISFITGHVLTAPSVSFILIIIIIIGGNKNEQNFNNNSSI